MKEATRVELPNVLARRMHRLEARLLGNRQQWQTEGFKPLVSDLQAIAKACRELSTELELLVNPDHPLNKIP